MKYTAHQLLKRIKKENNALLLELLVNLKDRKYQVWQRNSSPLLVFSLGQLKERQASPTK